MPRMENSPMSARKTFRWLVPAILSLTCGIALLAIHTGFLTPAVPLLTWILSTETLPLALIAGAAWFAHRIWRSHHPWRQQQ
jgi:hypothetical protein